jgi:hypothetical protein
MLTFAAPNKKSGNFMPEDNFLNQNADAQEIVITSTDVDATNAAATTNELVTTDDGGSNDMARMMLVIRLMYRKTCPLQMK